MNRISIHNPGCKALPVILLAGLAVATSHAQFSIDWHTIDGGGGTSSGGIYSVSGTIGQPDAGTLMTGGSFTLQGGFWSLVAVQTPGAPLLHIEMTSPTQATISWDPDDPGWELQESPVLVPSAWIDAPSGTTNPVTVPAVGPTLFYRLNKP